MSDQPQLQLFQKRVRKKCRKSNTLPQRPLLKQASQSKQNAVKERPLSSGGSDGKTPPINHRNVEKTISQETRQNYTKDRRTKVQQTQTKRQSEVNTEKNRKTVLQKGRKKK